MIQHTTSVDLQIHSSHVNMHESKVSLPCLMMQRGSAYTLTGLLLLGPSTLSCTERMCLAPSPSYVMWLVEKYVLSFCSLSLSSLVAPGWRRQRQTLSSLFASSFFRLWLQEWRTIDWLMVWFRADIDEILPVCVSPCRGLASLAQSNAFIWSPGSDSVLGD